MQKSHHVPKWMSSWQEKFKPLLVEGLTDGPTYVRLGGKSLPTLDVVLAFRPMVGRVTESAIMLGGKLSVFPVQDSLKVEPASEAVIVQWLLSAYPGVEFPKASPHRVGTIIAAMQDAPYHQGHMYKAKFRDSDMVDRLFDHIETMMGTPIEEREKAARAVRDAYLAMLPELFDATENAVIDSDAEVNVNGQYEVGDNVVSLVEKAALTALLNAVLPPPDGSKPN